MPSPFLHPRVTLLTFASYIHKANILVDKDGTPRIAGLGSAPTSPHSTARNLEGRASTDRLSRGCAPELNWPGASSNLTDPTKASDVYAFGVMAWEVQTDSFVWHHQFAHSRQVITGRPPFSEMTEIAASYSMLSGARPPRPDHHEISDGVWYMIEQCWDGVPSRRLSIGEVISILETESGRTPASCPSASART